MESQQDACSIESLFTTTLMHFVPPNPFLPVQLISPSDVRYVVLMKEMRWAETFSMLDAIPIHDFVSCQRATILATTTAYKHDCTLGTCGFNMKLMVLGMFLSLCAEYLRIADC
jgi:hypothetical protein